MAEVSEKEFLLSHATSVKKYQDFIEYTDENKELIQSWSGSGHFIDVKIDSKDNKKCKIQIKYDTINNFVRMHINEFEINAPQLNDINSHPTVIY